METPRRKVSRKGVAALTRSGEACSSSSFITEKAGLCDLLEWDCTKCVPEWSWCFPVQCAFRLDQRQWGGVLDWRSGEITLCDQIFVWELWMSSQNLSVPQFPYPYTVVFKSISSRVRALGVRVVILPLTARPQRKTHCAKLWLPHP